MLPVSRSAAKAAPSVLAAFRPRMVQARQLRLATVMQQRQMHFQPTRRMMKAPEDDHKAHTVTQRLAQLRKIPVELLPLAVVLVIAIVAAVYSLWHKLTTDVTLRLWRKGKQPTEDH